MIKDELRKQIKSTRKELLPEEVTGKSTLIIKNFIGSSLYKNAQNIMLYSPIANEVDTTFLIKKCFEDSKTVLLPVTENDTITPVQITADTVYKIGAYNIKEPVIKEIFDVESIDTIIIPGIAFDKSGTRIGFGKGCYDRFLINTNALKIGFCYDFQIVDEIEKSEFDIDMNYVITESELIVCE